MTGSIQERAWRIHGRVQGVGFRWWTVQTGSGLGLTGRVRNEPEGTVVIHARGGSGQLDTLAKKLRTGPLMARVSEVEEIPAEGPWPESGIEVVR